MVLGRVAPQGRLLAAAAGDHQADVQTVGAQAAIGLEQQHHPLARLQTSHKQDGDRIAGRARAWRRARRETAQIGAGRRQPDSLAKRGPQVLARRLGHGDDLVDVREQHATGRAQDRLADRGVRRRVVEGRHPRAVAAGQRLERQGWGPQGVIVDDVELAAPHGRREPAMLVAEGDADLELGPGKADPVRPAQLEHTDAVGAARGRRTPIAHLGRDDGHLMPEFRQGHGRVLDVNLHAAGTVKVVRADLGDIQGSDLEPSPSQIARRADLSDIGGLHRTSATGQRPPATWRLAFDLTGVSCIDPPPKIPDSGPSLPFMSGGGRARKDLRQVSDPNEARRLLLSRRNCAHLLQRQRRPGPA